MTKNDDLEDYLRLDSLTKKRKKTKLPKLNIRLIVYIS